MPSSPTQDATGAFLLCDAEFAVIYTSDVLQSLLQLPQQRSARSRDLFGLLGSSSTLEQNAAAAVLASLRETGLRPGVHMLPTESGIPIQLAVAYAGNSVWALSFADPQGEREAELLALSMTDTLVGVGNRRYFQRTVRESLRAGDRANAILLLDLDRFKTVNDTLGHSVGDQLLRKVGDRLSTVKGKGNALARLGGDEFAIWVTAASGMSAEKLALRIVDLLNRPFLIEAQQINIGVSIGIAFPDEPDISYERLMKKADLALYAAKESGRNGFRLFHPNLEEAAQARRKMEIDLRKALMLRQIEVYFRPRINVETGTIVGLQSMLRWRHPEQGLLEEALFLPLATEIGLLPALGKWLLKCACREAAALPESLPVAVSVTEQQFTNQESLVQVVRSALQSSGLDAGRLELEITEGMLLHQEESVLRTLHGLRELGVRIGMNGFGTGYASLSKVVSFPFDLIKIAPSLVVESGATLTYRAIVQAIATLGASLGVQTLIDGIDDRSDLDRVRENGGAEVQGCRLEAPLAPADLPSLFRSATALTGSREES